MGTALISVQSKHFFMDSTVEVAVGLMSMHCMGISWFHNMVWEKVTYKSTSHASPITTSKALKLSALLPL